MTEPEEYTDMIHTDKTYRGQRHLRSNNRQGVEIKEQVHEERIGAARLLIEQVSTSGPVGTSGVTHRSAYHVSE